jgi:hypothetical protein
MVKEILMATLDLFKNFIGSLNAVNEAILSVFPVLVNPFLSLAVLSFALGFIWSKFVSDRASLLFSTIGFYLVILFGEQLLGVIT